jgi:hypothetical protein
VAELLSRYGRRRGVAARIARELGYSEATISRDLAVILGDGVATCATCGAVQHPAVGGETELAGVDGDRVPPPAPAGAVGDVVGGYEDLVDEDLVDEDEAASPPPERKPPKSGLFPVVRGLRPADAGAPRRAARGGPDRPGGHAEPGSADVPGVRVPPRVAMTALGWFSYRSPARA